MDDQQRARALPHTSIFLCIYCRLRLVFLLINNFYTLVWNATPRGFKVRARMIALVNISTVVSNKNLSRGVRACSRTRIYSQSTCPACACAYVMAIPCMSPHECPHDWVLRWFLAISQRYIGVMYKGQRRAVPYIPCTMLWKRRRDMIQGVMYKNEHKCDSSLHYKQARGCISW
jgi:hypothetical protein